MKCTLLLKFVVAFLVVGCTQTPKPSTTLYVGLSDPPTTLDPRFATDANSERITDLIFSSLVRVDNKLNPIPEAAESWVFAPKRITFKIKEGLKFHNGRPVTLEDFVFSINEYKKPGSPFAANLNAIKNVVAKAPNTLVLELSHDDGSLLSNLVQVKVLPQEELKKPDFALSPVGSGPFRFKEQSTGTLNLLRVASAENKIHEVEFDFVRDENTRFLKAVKGDIDVLINELQEEKVAELIKSKKLNVLVTPGLNFNFVLLNLKDPRLSKLEMRQALFSAIEREDIVKYKLEGLATLGLSLLAPANPFAATDLQKDMRQIAKNDAKKIAQDLCQNDCTFSLKTSDQAMGNGLIIAENFERNLGLKINHQSFEWATYYSDVKAGRFQMAIMRWVGIVDPDILRDSLSSHEFPPGHNRGFYANSNFDSLVESAKSISTLKERREAYTKAQHLVMKELPILPLWYNSNISVLSPRVKNFEPSITGSFHPLENVSKE